MIQPIGAFSPRADFRGHGVKSERTPQEKSKAQVALINAAGISIIAGAFTTVATRGYTSSWAHSSVLGVFCSALLMSCFGPAFVGNASIFEHKERHNIGAVAKDGPKVSAKLKPAKKLVQFRQS